MRTLLWFILALSLASFWGHADRTLPGAPFDIGSVPIKWAVTNGFSTNKARLYFSKPPAISSPLVSNLLEIVGLSVEHQIKFDEMRAAPERLTLADPARRRTLTVSQVNGSMRYQDLQAKNDPTQGGVGVPEEAEVLLKAFNLLDRLGINRSEVYGSADPSHPYLRTEQTRRRMKDRGASPTVISRGISFSRLVDGCPSSENAIFVFGNHGELTSLEISWSPLDPLSAVIIPTQKQIIAALKSGRCFCDEETGVFKSIIVREATLFYWRTQNASGQLILEPFVELSADFQGAENTVHAEIYCPMTP